MATLEAPPMPTSGDPMTADVFRAWFTYLTVLAEQASVSVKEGSGLTLRQTSDGTEVGLQLPPGHYKAKITAQVGLASSDGMTLGTGTATIYTEVWNGTTYLLKPVQAGVKVTFGAPSGGKTTAIAAGQMVIVARMASGVYEVITGYC